MDNEKNKTTPSWVVAKMKREAALQQMRERNREALPRLLANVTAKRTPPGLTRQVIALQRRALKAYLSFTAQRLGVTVPDVIADFWPDREQAEKAEALFKRRRASE